MRIGKHTLECQPIEEVNFYILMNNVKADILYCDPPWGDSLMKYFATLNKKQTGKNYKPITYSDLLNRIKDIIAFHVSGYVFIECSIKDCYQVTTILSSILYNIRVFKVRYSGGYNNIISGGTAPHYNFAYDLSNMKGYEIPKLCISSCPGNIVLDPCCGLGYTARATVESGKIFIGNELNAKRCQSTKKILERDTNEHDKN